MIKIQKKLTQVNSFLTFVGGLLILVVSIIFTLDVIMRNAFNSPFSWSYDVGNYLLLCISLFPASYAFQKNIHVKMEIVVSNLNDKLGKICVVISDLLVLLLFTFLFYLSFQRMIHTMNTDQKTYGIISIPSSWLFIAICIMLFLLVLTVLMKFIKLETSNMLSQDESNSQKINDLTL